MLTETLTVIKYALNADRTIKPDVRASVISALSGNAVMAAPVPVRVWSRADVAEVFNRSLPWVDKVAAKGILKKIAVPGASRAAGFTDASVRALAEGRAVAL